MPERVVHPRNRRDFGFCGLLGTSVLNEDEDGYSTLTTSSITNSAFLVRPPVRQRSLAPTVTNCSLCQSMIQWATSRTSVANAVVCSILIGGQDHDAKRNRQPANQHLHRRPTMSDEKVRTKEVSAQCPDFSHTTCYCLLSVNRETYQTGSSFLEAFC